jgi:UDP-N-acetylglucosamine 2-epimerase (non-hydrolysing)
MKLCIVYGTRPEFLKLKVLIDYIKQHDKIQLKVIKINQHTEILDDNMYHDDILLIDSTSSNRLSDIGANILLKLPSLINECTHILAQGDTSSVFYSLLCGFQMKKTCIHLEAGMRTYDLYNPYPEEGYRQMISRITDIHLCPSDIEKNNLINEKVKGKIFVVGNTILDLVKSYNIPITYENNILITLHRRENWNDYKNYLEKICLLASNNTNITFTFLAHFNPSLQSILKTIENIPSNFNILQPLSHNELIKILSSCLCVITDSGGIQEEANFLGKHIYVLRKVTERNAISNMNMTLCSIDNIINIDISKKGIKGFEYGDGNSCNYIIKLLYTL